MAKSFLSMKKHSEIQNTEAERIYFKLMAIYIL